MRVEWMVVYLDVKLVVKKAVLRAEKMVAY